MNLYAFIASVVSSLAWPTLIAWILFLFLRRGASIESLILSARKYVKTVKVGSLELTLQDARQDAEQVAVQSGIPLGGRSEPDRKLVKLAELNSALAILEIWKDLDAEVIKLIQHNGMIRFSRPTHFMKVLRDQGKITASEYALYERLRHIRNEAVHSREAQPLTVGEILEYRSFADTLIARFEQIKAEPGYITVPLAKSEAGA